MAKFFLASGITLLVLIVGVMMWFGQQHLAKLKTQPRSHEQSQQQAEQALANHIEGTSRSLTDRKQAAVEHCSAVQGINAWLGCMEREGVNTRELLKTGQ
jgi:high-affinity Fe2+/Pb2+ permease